ncbi:MULTISPECIES: 4'-phosphopantetheinyl transferase family protein [Vibrio]|uniref:Enterobactin synthase component D n=2 Tax=Vibrio TaxID=662 RepID=A0A7X4RWG7_9VIBR|nr:MULTISPECIES: 4'-phosphopantetheinyl transferase superfamily protein [Vibrio]MBF9002469.1 4'-phosphopantetheinyl transferase superfamily protein [Vibrio nitrifigilis]MZI95365.1 4'-phosphopantetheinyl transferase superfamily protein [Vibrio eleionomae]
MSYIGVCQPLTLGQHILYLRQFHRHEFNERTDTCLVPLPETLVNAVNKRKAEFVAGRTAANDALCSLGYSDFFIEIGEHRAPIWPDSVVGSISHSDDLAIATCAMKSDCQAIGVDVQEQLTTQEVSDVGPMVVNQQEARCLASLNDDAQCSYDQAQQLTMAFSAKESLFKALYPRVKRYLDFSDAKLIAGNSQASTLTFALTPNLQDELSIERCLCHFYWIKNQVITSVTW